MNRLKQVNDMKIDDALEEFKEDKKTKEEIKELILKNSFTSIGCTNIDSERKIRRGFPETIYCKSKTPEDVKKIFESMAKKNDIILGTKAEEKHFQEIKDMEGIEINKEAEMIIYKKKSIKKTGKVIVLTAGTSDRGVAEEASITAECMGSMVTRRYDYGVAGLNRLLSIIDEIEKANVIIAVAGMEGALPSVVSGLVSKPIIAVPTSVGYGTNLNGISALLTMLNTCSPGVSVVNIDNGFGAGYMAALINNQSEKK